MAVTHNFEHMSNQAFCTLWILKYTTSEETIVNIFTLIGWHAELPMTLLLLITVCANRLRGQK